MEAISMARALTTGVLIAASTLVCTWPAAANHTIFSYQVDRLEGDGNMMGPKDGLADFVDEFNNGTLSPNWYRAYGTAFESGDFLFITSPGQHYPAPDGSTVDLSIVASLTFTQEGAGDFTATAYWEPIVPDVDHHYHFSLFTFGSVGPGDGFNEIFGLGIRSTSTALEIDQHLTELDQSAGIYRNTMLDYFPISASNITGQIVFRLDFDDSTNLATSSFSLDGGVTWQSPFLPGEIFVNRTRAQFILSADPTIVGGSTSTTTTTTTTTTIATTSTTSTTLPPGACSAVGCKISIAFRRGHLGINRKSNVLAWKFRKGEATSLGDFGSPTSTTSYDFCIGDVTGATIFEASIPPGGTCGTRPCWKVLRNRGYKYKDPAGTAAGIRQIRLRSTGEDGRTAVIVKGRGANLVPPNLPLNLPVTVRLGASNGECWAGTFSTGGMFRNTSTQFSGR
jgi:hypothetical protein